VDYSALPHSSGDELSTYVAEDVSFCDGIIFLEAGDNCPQRGVTVADQVFEPIILCLARVVRLRITQCHGVMNIPYGGRKTRRLAAEPESALHYHATVRPLDIVCIEVVDDGDGWRCLAEECHAFLYLVDGWEGKAVHLTKEVPRVLVLPVSRVQSFVLEVPSCRLRQMIEAVLYVDKCL